MKFLIDENVGNSIVRYLKNKGHNVIVASKKGLRSREDTFLLDHAFREGRVHFPRNSGHTERLGKI